MHSQAVMIFVVIAMVLSTAFLSGCSKNEDASSSYFPVKLGSTYKYDFLPASESIPECKVDVRVIEQEFKGRKCIAYKRESSVPSMAMSDYLFIENGNIMCHGNDMDSGKPNEIYFLFDPPVVLHPKDIKPGFTWDYAGFCTSNGTKLMCSSKAVALPLEKITVPLGTFECLPVKVEVMVEGLPRMDSTVYYARGIGMVRYIVSYGTFDLTAYSIPK